MNVGMYSAAVPVSVTTEFAVTLVTLTFVPLTAAVAEPEVTEAPRFASQLAS